MAEKPADAIRRLKREIKDAAIKVFGLRVWFREESGFYYYRVFNVDLLTPTNFRWEIGALIFDIDTGKVKQCGFQTITLDALLQELDPKDRSDL